MVRDFQNDLEEERQNIKVVPERLISIFSLNKIRDATYEEQTIEHIDLIGTTDENKKITFEVKLRSSDYGDLLIETYSILERKIRGWIYVTTADYLVYVILNKKKKISKIFILYLDKLQKWWNTTGVNMNYPIKDVKNKGYITRNRVVPFQQLPLDFFYYHNSYGKLFTGEELDSSYYR